MSLEASATRHELPPLLCVVGPTASGKSALAVTLARALNAEVISVDASQVYEDLDIGTGKLTPSEAGGVPHHLLSVVAPDGRFDASIFLEHAERAIRELASRGKRAVLCGGTGLYFKALLYGLCEAPPVSEEVRQRLAERVAAGEVEQLHAELSAVDPTLAARLQPKDKQRVERALGVYLTTGTPLSALQASHGFSELRAPVMMVGIDHERTALNERIERRVRQMWTEGFLEEVEALKAQGYSEALQSMGALGYRLALSHLDGALSREEAITKMIHATRQYARRQRRYFDRQLPTSWRAPEGLSDPLSTQAQALINEARTFFEVHEPSTAPSPTLVPFEVRLWGDKSIAHRAFMLSALLGSESHPVQSVVSNIGEGADIASTREALKALGVSIEPTNSGEAWRVTGRGFQALKAPAAPINCGNSGTTIRLLSGLLSGLPDRVTLDGDESLRRRPMRRLERALAPLGRGLEVGSLGGAPVSVGAPLNTPISSTEHIKINTELASAQVKSAALLASLTSEAPCVEVRERALSRDHSERMLSALGARLGVCLTRDVYDPLTVRLEQVEQVIEKVSGTEQVPGTYEPPDFKVNIEVLNIEVPGDPSSAAFWVAVSALSPPHAPPVLLRSCLINPTRIGFFKVARRMGVELELRVSGERLGEPVADVCVWGAPQGLRGVEVSAEEVLDCLDELPLVALLGALAQGHTRVVGAEELRVKESDRVEAMATLLNALGARVTPTPDGWEIEGVEALQGGEVSSAGDHRVALCGHIAQLAARGEVRVLGSESAAISYPEFHEVLRAFQARWVIS